MSKLEFPPSETLYPAPVILVSCIDRNNHKTNIITIAWCGVACSRPPLLTVSIRPSRYSHKLISDTGDFVINIPTSDLVKKVDQCGIRSGKDTDKFTTYSLTASPSSKISSPMIQECPVNIECVLKNTLRLGSHDMFIGEVVSVHIDEELLGANGMIDYKKARPFVYNQGEYWGLGEKIGHYGFSKE